MKLFNKKNVENTSADVKRQSVFRSVLPTVVASVLVMILFCSGLFSTAYIKAESEAIENHFLMAALTSKLNESFNGTVKKNVNVENTGEVDEFVRIRLVFSWQTAEGGYSLQSVKASDITVTYNTTDWVKSGDYWYHKKLVKPGEKTADLIGNAGLKLSSAGAGNCPEGYTLCVDVIAETVQATPAAVEDFWGITATNGVLQIVGG